MDNYPNGTTFIKRGRKNKANWTVTDRLETFNRAGELVKVRYVATSNVLGQTITDNDLVAVTIARGLAE